MPKKPNQKPQTKPKIKSKPFQVTPRCGQKDQEESWEANLANA